MVLYALLMTGATHSASPESTETVALAGTVMLGIAAMSAMLKFTLVSSVVVMIKVFHIFG
jgi:type IV secretory pathway VirB2 component (pilin)